MAINKDIVSQSMRMLQETQNLDESGKEIISSYSDSSGSQSLKTFLVLILFVFIGFVMYNIFQLLKQNDKIISERPAEGDVEVRSIAKEEAEIV